MDTVKKLYKVEALVKEFLIDEPETRNNDTLLQKKVYERINPDVLDMSFGMVMDNRKDLGLPPFESIRRARAKLQREYDNLRADEEVEEARAEQEESYRAFVRNE